MSAEWCDDSREQRARRTIFVGNLHTTLSTAEVARHVERACGLRPVEVHLPRREDGTLAGYGFVELPSAADADRLVATGLPPLVGRSLIVKPRRPRDGDRNGSSAPTQSTRLPAQVFLGNVPAGASEFDLERHVAAVAPVVTVGLPRGRDGRAIGVAFVVLADPGAAGRVVRELDGVVFQGRALRVTFARGRGAA
jgi:RNA recognition motif-containing protein